MSRKSQSFKAVIEFGEEIKVEDNNKPFSATSFMKKLIELYNNQSKSQVETSLHSVFTYFDKVDIRVDPFHRDSALIKVVALLLQNKDNKPISAMLHQRVLDLFTNQPFIQVKLNKLQYVDGILALRIDYELSEITIKGKFKRVGNKLEQETKQVQYNKATVIRANKAFVDKIKEAIILEEDPNSLITDLVDPCAFDQ